MPLNVTDVGAVAKLRWRLQGDPDEMVSTIGLLGGGGDPVQLAHDVWEAWVGAWNASVLGNKWAFVGVDVSIGYAPVVSVGSWDEISAGTHTAATLPQNCALLLRKKTAKAGKRQHGRMFLPAGYLQEAEVTETGALTPALLGQQQGNATQFLANLADDPGLTAVLFHNIAADAGPAGPDVAPTPITGLTVDPVIATQRHRLRR